jgi:hypothetical protein
MCLQGCNSTFSNERKCDRGFLLSCRNSFLEKLEFKVIIFKFAYQSLDSYISICLRDCNLTFPSKRKCDRKVISKEYSNSFLEKLEFKVNFFKLAESSLDSYVSMCLRGCDSTFSNEKKCDRNFYCHVATVFFWER